MTTNSKLTPPAELAGDHYRIAISGKRGAGRYALIDQHGLDALHAAGVRRLFICADAAGAEYLYAVVPETGLSMSAARLIVGDPENSRVEFHGSRLDLRRRNLHVRSYLGVGRKRAGGVAA